MNKAKLVMAIYALAAILSMVGIGLSISLLGLPGDKYDTSGFIGILIGIIAMCVVFMMGFKMKRKLRDKGLL